MPRCREGELVIIDKRSEFRCECMLGMPFVTTKFNVVNGTMFWKLPKPEPACIHYRVAGFARISVVSDDMCRPIRPPTVGSMHQPV